MAQYFWELFSACENLWYLWLFPVGFINFHQIVFKWEHFEKKFSKACFQHKVKNSDFRKNGKKYLTLTMRCDQTTRPIRKQKASLERWYPYLSCFTLGFEIYAHQLGHNGSGKIMVPCGQRQKVSDMSISSGLSIIFLQKGYRKK